MRENAKVMILVSSCLAIIAIGCGGGPGNNPKTQPGTNTKESGPDLSVRLGKEEAISKVKQFLQTREDSVTVQVPYQESETVSQPCSQIDVDTDPNKGDESLARCKPIGGSGPGAPYGSRSITESRTRCCKTRTIRWTTLQPTWTAEYSKATDSWSVNMEFEVDTAKKAIEWIVNDKSGAVTEKPEDK